MTVGQNVVTLNMTLELNYDFILEDARAILYMQTPEYNH